MKKWPFPGDHPVSRARKMALAYRALAQEQQQAREDIRAALEKLDRRLIAYDNPASLTLIDQALKALDGDGVKDLDDRFTSWGETWHAEQPQTYGPDDFVKGDVAASLIHISKKSISTLRINGRLKGTWDPDMGTAGGYWYKVADVYELSTTLRGRNWRQKESTDTLKDSGRSDTE